MTSGMPSQSPRKETAEDILEASPWHHVPVLACMPKVRAGCDGSDLPPMGLGQESDREGEVVS